MSKGLPTPALYSLYDFKSSSVTPFYHMESYVLGLLFLPFMEPRGIMSRRDSKLIAVKLFQAMELSI